MNFEDKNVIIGYSNHPFANLYIDMLLHSCDIASDRICMITLDDEINDTLPSEHKIYIDYYKNHSIGSLSSAKTITFISLKSNNSFLLKELLENSEDVANKIYVHLTEDEMSRWVQTKRKYGKIIITKKNFVSDNCLYVLPKLKNFIASEKAFRDDLEEALGRNDFNIIDARDAFSVMPTLLLDKFRALYHDDSKNTLPENKILIGGKRGAFPFREIVAILNSLDKQGILLKNKYMVFTYEKRKLFRVMLDLYCLYLRHIKKKIIDISYPTVTNSVTYNSLVMSCSHIILQKRGSMTAVKEFVRLGRGVVHVENGTRNERELTQSIDIDVARYSNLAELAKNIEDNNIDIRDNQRRIEERFMDSYHKLNRIYR